MTSKHQIAAVTPGHGLTLTIEWRNGRRHTVDLTGHIRRFAVLKPLTDAEVFKRVAAGEWGHDVTWGDDLEIAASTLYRLALEQAGDVMPTDAFREWMAANGLSLTAAAQELGFTRRTITAYSSGAAMIPKHVALACKGWALMRAS